MRCLPIKSNINGRKSSPKPSGVNKRSRSTGFNRRKPFWPMTNMVSNVGFPMVCSIRVG
ncbi:Uncharacterised protein [Vibrio cholerae]|nr:Uncharacterised protein [Vibrio cholerae]